MPEHPVHFSRNGARVRCAVAALLLPLMAISFAHAAQPVIDRLQPTGLKRGEPTTITLLGNRLEDARQILWERPGVEVGEIKPVDNKNVQISLTTSPDLAPGLYPFRVVTATGVSNLRLLSVGALPIVPEVEPNSEFGAPQKIDLNVTVTGVVTREDEDYFAVDLKAGQRLCCEIEGLRLAYFPRNNSEFFDPYIAVLDAERFEQATSDDAPLLQQDALCSFTATTDGTYIIVVRDSAFGGADDFEYRLHVGDFPRPVAVVPAGGQPGQTLEATYVGVDGSTWTAPLELPATEALEYPVSFTGPSGVAPSPNTVRVLPMPVALEQEPNDDITTPTVVEGSLPLAACGRIEREGDHDSFAFQVAKDQRVVVRLFARSVLRSPLDGVIDIFDPANNRVAGNDDAGRPDSIAEFTAAAEGRYVVRVRDHLLAGGPDYAYRLEVDVARPELTLSLPERRQDEPVDFTVPRGGRMAVMVNAERRNFGGDLDLTMENLPAGISMTAFKMPADRATIPLLLSAAADAELAGARVDLQGRPATGEPDIIGHLLQRHKLVAGQNRVDVWGLDADRVAVAVTEAAPVDIELVAPTVPIVRNGSAELKVVARRTDGFESEIPVRLLYVPPGISTNNSRKIEEKQNEITIPITANKNSALGRWPMIVTAFANTGNGRIELASLPVELTVEDVFFNLSFPKTSTELGASTQVVVGVEVARPFEGTAEVTLVGLPAGVTSSAPTQSVTAETTELVFPITVAADARTGSHKTLVAQAVVHSPAGDIAQTEGTGELQIDTPLPAPAAAAPPAADPEPAVEAPVPALAKPLSRIEQLRQDRQK